MARLYRPLGTLRPQSNIDGHKISPSFWNVMVQSFNTSLRIASSPKGLTLTELTNPCVVCVLALESHPRPGNYALEMD